ncbi:MAG TPA: nuclear transport factor 2 family protein [Longimicrobium sp.]|nr:nuclear transport factor 2 family protein [Longimicrobium sp.]
MRHSFPVLAAAALVALSACDLVKVERTPRGFYTQRDPGRIDQQDAASELRARVRNFADELGQGDRGRAIAALNPTEDVLVMGSGISDGVGRIGRRALALALDSLGVATPANAQTTDLRVQVGLRESTGWFSTPIRFIPNGGTREPEWLRASGVYAQDRGEWKLVQIHLSRPHVVPDTARADSARRDSVSRRDSARAARPDSAPRR